MQNLPKPIRLFAPLAALLAAVLVITGCGTTSPDIARGRVLFPPKGGVRHTLAQAGTTATIGPNLDDAFAAAREVGGFDDATVEGIVKDQIDNPRPSNGNPAASMPAHIDEALPGQSEAEIEESILDPNAKITQGYPANVMPQNFKETIKPEEIKELVKFLSENAGKSKE